VSGGFQSSLFIRRSKGAGNFWRPGDGRLIVIRARYGHAGASVMTRSGAPTRSCSGGGELIDQGVHLMIWRPGFSARFTRWRARRRRILEHAVDDNAFLNLQTAKGRTRCCTSVAPSGRIFLFEISDATPSCTLKASRQFTVRETLSLPDEPGDGPAGHEAVRISRPDECGGFERIEFEKDVELKRQPDAGLRVAKARWRWWRKLRKDETGVKK